MTIELGTGSSSNPIARAPSRSARTGGALELLDQNTTHHSGLALVWQGDTPRIPSPLTRKRSRWLKRIMDVAISSLALVLLLPAFVLIAIAIRCDGHGKVLFVQQREGLGGRLFGILKFRTMSVAGGQFGAEGDRVTRVGAILRRTSIDELPQLFNVLAGHMSLVGPRPHVPHMLVHDTPYTGLVPYYRQRQQVLPGITGWAQANGYRGQAGPTAAIRRIEHDIAYIQNASLALDVVILLRTLKREFLTGTGR